MNRSFSRSLTARFLIVLAAVTLLSTNATAESAKRREVRTLLKLTGADKIGKQVMTQLLSNFRRSFRNVPAKYWRKLQRRLDTKELVEQIVPVYEKHFTIADIRGLIAFYRSPVGKKFVRVQPKLVQESMAIGQAWGQKIARQVARELQNVKK